MTRCVKCKASTLPLNSDGLCECCGEPERVLGFLPLGTETEWGTVEGVSITDGERYYWMVRDGDVALMPAATVEAE